MTGTTDDLADLGVDDLSADDVERLRDALVNGEGIARDRAAETCLALAEDDADSVLPLVPALTTVLETADATTVLKAASTLGIVADRRPDAVTDAVGPLAGLLTHDLPKVQVAAANALRPVGTEHPEMVAPHVDALVDALAADVVDPMEGADQVDATISNRQFRQQLTAVRDEERRRQREAQGIAEGLLFAVADHDPDAVAPYAPTIVDLLSVEDTDIVACAAAILGTVAAADPGTVDGAVAPLVDCLAREDDAIRTYAIHALGHLDDPTAVEPLRELASDGALDESVREIARETAEWLDREPS